MARRARRENGPDLAAERRNQLVDRVRLLERRVHRDRRLRRLILADFRCDFGAGGVITLRIPKTA
jgi:hypothetical protein